MKNVQVGQRVRARKRIIENDVLPNPTAEPCEPGWVHAEEGEEGEVVFVEPLVNLVPQNEVDDVDPDEQAVTVAFDRSQTATLVMDEEIHFLDE